MNIRLIDPVENLLKSALARDREAQRLLVEKLTPVIKARVKRALLRRAASASGGNIRQEVEDLTQEVFVALLSKGGKALRAWEPGGGLSLPNFVGWLAERLVASKLRTRRGNPWTEAPTVMEQLDGPAEDASTELRVLSRQMLEALLGRLREELSPLGRSLFEQLFLQQLSVAEVSEQTGMSRDAVYAWQSRLVRVSRRLGAELSLDSQASPQVPKVSATRDTRRALGVPHGGETLGNGAGAARPAAGAQARGRAREARSTSCARSPARATAPLAGRRAGAGGGISPGRLHARGAAAAGPARVLLPRAGGARRCAGAGGAAPGAWLAALAARASGGGAGEVRAFLLRPGEGRAWKPPMERSAEGAVRILGSPRPVRRRRAWRPGSGQQGADEREGTASGLGGVSEEEPRTGPHPVLEAQPRWRFLRGIHWPPRWRTSTSPRYPPTAGTEDFWEVLVPELKVDIGE